METPFAAGGAREAQRRKTARVLIVDDDPATRTICAINLQLEGLVVVEATNGRHGLTHARSELPDLVVTDVTMPVLDGFGLAEALRSDERTSHIPLIFLTGETTAASRARADELGALAYLTKPIDPPTLVSVVADALARSDDRSRNGGAQSPAARFTES